MERDLTKGPVMRTMLRFAAPIYPRFRSCLKHLRLRWACIREIAGFSQDFGNAFSIFIAQNYGAQKEDRIRAGLKGAIFTAFIFCTVISAIVWVFSDRLMGLFVNVEDKEITQIVSEGIRYLHIEGAFYIGIGCLFLLYGLYRALGKPGMSVVLTVISLGTRVVLSYSLSSVPYIGVVGIWWSVPIGWFLADMTGLVYYLTKMKQFLRFNVIVNEKSGTV